MFQRFWDSAMALGPLDDETDTQSQMRFIIIIYNICRTGRIEGDLLIV